MKKLEAEGYSMIQCDDADEGVKESNAVGGLLIPGINDAVNAEYKEKIINTGEVQPTEDKQGNESNKKCI